MNTYAMFTPETAAAELASIEERAQTLRVYLRIYEQEEEATRRRAAHDVQPRGYFCSWCGRSDEPHMIAVHRNLIPTGQWICRSHRTAIVFDPEQWRSWLPAQARAAANARLQVAMKAATIDETQEDA